MRKLLDSPLVHDIANAFAILIAIAAVAMWCAALA